MMTILIPSTEARAGCGGLEGEDLVQCQQDEQRMLSDMIRARTPRIAELDGCRPVGNEPGDKCAGEAPQRRAQEMPLAQKEATNNEREKQ
jgi:hypothetical protein